MMTGDGSRKSATDSPENWRGLPMRSLLYLSAALALSGCGGSTPYVESADPCADPVQIPRGWLSDRQIEVLWARDRQELLNCGDKVETLSGREPH